ncbi:MULTISPECIES: histidine kinase [unclassified Nostoc]|nr:histidine kinase [Nostoc sp. JL33]MBN3868831.1 histidine kinase [Nostoc sp. JL33]
MGSGEWGVGDEGDEGDEGVGEEELLIIAQCPMPYAQFPTPNAQSSIQY